MTPQQSETDERVRRGGLQLIWSSVVIGVLVIAVGFLVFQNTALTNALTGVSTGLTQQRDQFEACKDKPATTRGCTQPVAAEPEVIIRQGQRGLPGIPGAMGATGRDGRDGKSYGCDGNVVDETHPPAKCPGPQGQTGLVGKQGPPPGCALLASACMGKDGRDGIDGKDGLPGKDGAAGQDGKPGADGAPGAEGKPGRGIASMTCPDDGDPTTDDAWEIDWTAAPLHTRDGVCRPKTQP